MTLEIYKGAVTAALKEAVVPVLRGKVLAADRQLVEGTLPGARTGMRVSLMRNGGAPVSAEIVGCDANGVTLAPLSRAIGIGPGDRIETAPLPNHIFTGNGMLGRVVDAVGRPIDGGPEITDTTPFALERSAPNPLVRPPVTEQLETGIRVIDGLFGIGVGQRLGLFAGPGLGKTTLLGMLAGQANSDVNVVCLVGERGREVGSFMKGILGDEGLMRTVVVLAPADAPPMARIKALDTATAVSEWFRDQHRQVLLLVDSLTRVLRARRELGLALGEPPARDGFPASAFAPLPGLVERTGNSERGAITAIYTVLTEGNIVDPVAEEARSLLDGHILLSEKQANAGIWPAVDVVRSISRVFGDIAPEGVLAAATDLKRMLAAYEENEDLILMGAYRRGASPDTDRALARREGTNAFLGQKQGEISPLRTTFGALKRLVDIE